jgi:hypothetical protein
MQQKLGLLCHNESSGIHKHIFYASIVINVGEARTMLKEMKASNTKVAVDQVAWVCSSETPS